MEFKLSFLPIIFGILILYGIIGIGVLKNDIKGIYRRWTRKDKFTVLGLVVLSVLVMLLFASRQEGQPEAMGYLTAGVNEMLLWVFHQDIQVMTLAVYLMFSVPVMVLGTAIIDEIGQQKKWLALPFYYYLFLFEIAILFYHPIRVPISGWMVLLSLVGFVYCLIKTMEQGKTKKKELLLALMLIAAVLVMLLDQGIAWKFLLSYVLLFAETFLAAVVINRASVLRKTLWHIVTLLVFVGLFFLHFFTI